MKKTKLTRSLLAACSIVALAAVMYGCESGPSQSELDEETGRADAAEAEAAAAEAEAATATAAAAKAQEEADAAEAKAAEAADDAAAAEAAAREAAAREEAAKDAVADAVEAGIDAADAKAEAEKAAANAEEARMKAEEARMKAEEAQKEAEKAKDVAEAAQKEAEEERDEAQMEAEDLQAEIDAEAAAKASADAKELLNMALRNLPADADAATAGIQFGDPVVTIPVPPGVTLSVSNEGMLMAEATDYTMAEMAPDMIEGWRGAMLTNAGGDTAVVYSDIGNDGTVSLLNRYTSNLPGSDEADRSWPIDNDDSNDGGTSGNADENDISWTSVMRPADAEAVMGGTVPMPTLKFAGTVHGIPGMFSCTGDTCVAPARFSDGSVQSATGVAAPNASAAGSWTFVPDDGADLYTDDEEYVTFGWWLDKGPDGKPAYVHLITGAEGFGVARTATSTTGTNLRGAATYSGAAAGKYAIANQADDTYEGGHFTANAMLMVDFDVDLDAAAAGNDRNGVSLSGMIDNFMTGDTARPDWSVALMVDGDATAGTPDDNMATPLTALVGDTDASMTTEWATGAAQSGTGTWTAMFYGGGDAAENTAHPSAVTGTFNAHIGTDDADTGAVGRMQGAFGANKDME